MPVPGGGFGARSARQGTLVLVGSGGGLLFWSAGVPAGALVGSLLAVATLNLLRPATAVTLDRRLKVGGLILLGTVAGASLTRQTILAMAPIALPFLLALAIMITVSACLSLMVARWSGLDLRTALLAMAPGGLTEVTAIADEAGAQTSVVLALHLLRVALVVTAGLPILAWIASRT